MLIQSIKAVNMVVLMLFLGCALYSLCAHSQSPPHANDGALTVVDVGEDEDDDGVVSVEENGENGGSTTEEKPKEYDVFYPTNEWQPVKPGQAVPAGLHIRMNLQTGEREAKLKEEDSGMKFWEAEGHQGMVNTDKKSFSRDELKRALKDFKSNVDGGGQDTKQAEKIKKKFRSYNELKEDFEKINMAIKTDNEIMSELLTRFKQVGANIEMKRAVLEELEYHLHKIDNAQTFCDLGGMPFLVSSLNDTSTVLQSEAAVALGAALQSNPKVQINAIEHGAMHQLLKMISTTSSTSVQKKCLFALSSLSRHFPFAQKKFLDLGGLSALKLLFEDSSSDSKKLQIKAITFLNDLLVEKELSEKHSQADDSVDMERLRQYRQVDLKKSMHEGGWCEMFPQLLNVHDHDAREKVLQAMNTMVSECRPNFSSAVMELEKLKSEYEALAVEEKEEGDDYFTGLAKLVTTMLTSVQVRDEL